MTLYSEEWFYPNGSLATNQRAIVFGPGDSNLVASIYSDAGLTVPLPNPTTTDGSGVLTFYAADGTYWIWVGPSTGGNGVEVTLGAAPGDPVLAVNGEGPDGFGNVQLDAADVGADPAGSAAAAAAASQPIATIDAAGDLYIGTGNNATTRLPIGSAGQILTVSGGTAAWQAAPSAPVTSVNGETGNVTLDAADVGADPAGSAAAVLATSLQKASNLSDLASAATARTNLGLGNSATLNVGTTAGTVAAGDDSRITGAQQRSTITQKGGIYAGTGAATTAELAPGVDGRVLTTNSATSTGLEWAIPATAPVTSVNGETGAVVLDATDVGALPLTGGTITGDVLFSGATSDLTVQGATTLSYKTVTQNVMEMAVSEYSTGLVSGGNVTINADPTKVNISAIFGYIVDSTTDPTNPTVTRIDLPAQTGLSMTPASLARLVTTWAVDATSTIVQIDSTVTAQQRRDLLILGSTIQFGGVITRVDPTKFFAHHPFQQTLDLMRSLSPFVMSGLSITPNPATLTFGRASGQVFLTGGNVAVDLKSPNIVNTITVATQSFRYATQLAGSLGALGTTVIPGSYDNAGVITAIPGAGSRATLQRIFLFPNVGTTGVNIQYGQEWYNTIDDAVAAIGTASFVTSPDLANALPIAVMAVRKDATNLADTTQARFYPLGRLTGSAAGAALISAPVTSVNSKTGAVVLVPSDIGSPALSTLTTKGDLYVATASATVARQGVGANGRVLAADSAQTNGVAWQYQRSFSVYPRSTGYVPVGGVPFVRSSKAATLNSMFLIPFWLLADATISGLAFEVSGNVATAVVRTGVYAADATTLLPTGSPLVDNGTTAADTTGTKTVAFALALSGGAPYYLAIVGQTAAPTLRHAAGLSPIVSNTTFPSGSGAGWNNAFVQTGVSGALPAIGVLADNDAPLVGLKF
jgi:hypothetical protein